METEILIYIFLTLIHQCISAGYDRVFENALYPRDNSDKLHFSYDSETNGTDWDKFVMCQNGSNQSPINIESNSYIYDLVFNSEDIPLSSFEAPKFRMWNNGHSIAVDFVPINQSEIFPGKGLSDKRYKFSNGHFHWGKSSYFGSEHLVNNKRHSMELHLVHIDPKFNKLEEALDSNDTNTVAVFAILFEVDPTADPSPALAPIVKQLEDDKFLNFSGKEEDIYEKIDWNSLFTTRSKWLSLPPRIFNYQGSLTTPPCKEGIDWYVYENPSTISESDVAAFRRVMDLYEEPLVQNYRSVKPLSVNATVRSIVIQK